MVCRKKHNTEFFCRQAGRQVSVRGYMKQKRWKKKNESEKRKKEESCDGDGAA